MRLLVVSPVGGTRRSLEIWTTELGHKVLVDESFDHAARILNGNPDIETVVSEWLLNEYTAYDLFKRAGRVTRVTDAAEVSRGINFMILINPGAQNAKLSDQLDTLKSLDQVVMLEKPICRSSVARSLAGFQAKLSDSVDPSTAPSQSPAASQHAPAKGSAADIDQRQSSSDPRALDMLSSLTQLLKEAQQTQHELRSLIREAKSCAGQNQLTG